MLGGRQWGSKDSGLARDLPHARRTLGEDRGEAGAIARLAEHSSIRRKQRSIMSTNHLLVWNAHGLNNRARRNVVRDVAEQQRASIVCLQETKVANLSASMNADLTRAGFDFACLPTIGVAGGAVTSWRRDL